MKQKKTIIWTVVIVLVIAAVILGISLLNKKQEPELVFEQYFEDLELEEDKEESVDLGDGLALLSFENTSGVYIEDGSDTSVESIGVAVIQNNTENTLQLAEIILTVDGESYHFQLTTLPAGEIALVQEKERKTFPKDYEDIQAIAEDVVFFREEPSLHEDTFRIQTGDYQITLTNKTEEKIAGPIYVYYKVNSNRGYIGGITYRVTFSDLEAGASADIMAGHFVEDTCEVLFVDYAK